MKSGDVVEGNFVNGKMEGPGSEKRADGSVYRGNYLHNQRHGQGTLTKVSGSKYEGEWRNGQKHGQGIYTKCDGSTQIFYFNHGKPCNYTEQMRPLDNTTSSALVIGKMKSVLVADEGKVGAFEYKKSGYGVQKLPWGGRYEGFLQNGKKHGQGKLYNQAGEVLEGEFRYGKMFNGKGVLTHKDGGSTEGTWVEGLVEGPGKYCGPSGLVYVGNFCKNLKHGHGVITFADGSIEEGEYVAGKLHGPGKYTKKDGFVFEGVFKDGKLYNGRKYRAY